MQVQKKKMLVLSRLNRKPLVPTISEDKDSKELENPEDEIEVKIEVSDWEIATVETQAEKATEIKVDEIRRDSPIVNKINFKIFVLNAAQEGRKVKLTEVKAIGHFSLEHGSFARRQLGLAWLCGGSFADKLDCKLGTSK